MYVLVRGAGDPVIAEPNPQMIDQTKYRVRVQSGNDLLSHRREDCILFSALLEARMITSRFTSTSTEEASSLHGITYQLYVRYSVRVDDLQ